MIATQLVFYASPWLTWNGRQAVLFDLAARKFYIFGIVFWPQDFIYLTILLMISAYSLFLFTTVAGRLWCGYACPQTVYTEIFLWVERVVEGDRRSHGRQRAGPDIGGEPGVLLQAVLQGAPARGRHQDVDDPAGRVGGLAGQQRVAVHALSAIKGAHTTVAEHMPASHRAHLEWTPAKLIAWGERIGAATGAVVVVAVVVVVPAGVDVVVVFSSLLQPATAASAASEPQPASWTKDRLESRFMGWSSG